MIWVINEWVKDLKFDYIIFNFLVRDRYIDEGKILAYIVLVICANISMKGKA